MLPISFLKPCQEWIGTRSGRVDTLLPHFVPLSLTLTQHSQPTSSHSKTISTPFHPNMTVTHTGYTSKNSISALVGAGALLKNRLGVDNTLHHCRACGTKPCICTCVWDYSESVCVREGEGECKFDGGSVRAENKCEGEG